MNLNFWLIVASTVIYLPATQKITEWVLPTGLQYSCYYMYSPFNDMAAQMYLLMYIEKREQSV